MNILSVYFGIISSHINFPNIKDKEIEIIIIPVYNFLLCFQKVSLSKFSRSSGGTLSALTYAKIYKA